MGYRSDVTCLMYGASKVEQAIVNEWLRQRIAGREDEENFDIDEHMAQFNAKQWKWYESYTDVQFLENLFKEFVDTFIEGEHDPKYGFEFARVGEDYTDIVTQYEGRCHYKIHIARSIVIE